MNRKTLILSIVIVLIVITGITMWFLNSNVDTEKSVKIGVFQSWILEGPFYVAQEQGFYEEEGINVEIIEFGSVDDFIPAIISKQVLVSESIADMFIVQASRISNIRQILRKATIFGVDGILATNNIQRATDLRGKDIAVQTISPSHYLLLNYLRDGGVSSNEVTLLPTEGGNAGAIFVAGKIDVAVTWEPWLSRATERKNSHILFSTANSPELIYDILITRDDLTSTEKKQVKAILRAWFKALAWMEDHPKETVEIFSKNLGLPKEEVEFFLTKLEFMNYKNNLQFYGNNSNLGPVEQYTNKAAQIWFEENIIDDKPSPKDIIETTYLNQLYE